MADVIGYIPLNMEVIVHIAFRFHGAELSEDSEFVRCRVRTPQEMERAVEAVGTAMWNGTLKLARKTTVASTADATEETTNG